MSKHLDSELHFKRELIDNSFQRTFKKTKAEKEWVKRCKKNKNVLQPKALLLNYPMQQANLCFTLVTR